MFGEWVVYQIVEDPKTINFFIVGGVFISIFLTKLVGIDFQTFLNNFSRPKVDPNNYHMLCVNLVKTGSVLWTLKLAMDIII